MSRSKVVFLVSCCPFSIPCMDGLRKGLTLGAVVCFPGDVDGVVADGELDAAAAAAESVRTL